MSPDFSTGITCTDVCTFTVTVTPVAGVTFYRDWDLDGWGDTDDPDHFVGCPEGYYPSYLTFPVIVMTQTLQLTEYCLHLQG